MEANVPDIKDVSEIILNALTILGGILVGLWAYTIYVVERSLLSPTEFDVECARVNPDGDLSDIIVDVGIHLKNVGSATLVIRWLFLDIRYIKRSDVSLNYLSGNGREGRLEFKHSLSQDVGVDTQKLADDILVSLKKKKPKFSAPISKPRGIPVVVHDTFVQPGVNQRYSFVTKLPQDAICILMYASFEYAQRPKRIQNFIYRISRSLGLVHYSLQHVREPHVTERVFWL